MAWWNFGILEVQILVVFLMSNRRLLRVKNNQKMPYKNRKAPSSRKISHLRSNDRFGLKIKR